MQKKNFELRTRVRFVLVDSDRLENQTGTILGKSFEDVGDHYIVLLDVPQPDMLAICITEHCLEPVE